MQFGVNHLGPVALTAPLLPRLLSTEGSRVVAISSNAHKPGRIDFDDLMGRTKYSAWGAYNQSKLANLLFTRELQRRLAAADATTIAVAAHPGGSRTNLGHESSGGSARRTVQWSAVDRQPAGGPVGPNGGPPDLEGCGGR